MVSAKTAGWKQKQLEAVKAVTNIVPDDKELVYSSIRSMLAALNDPYTRFLTPDQYESLAAYNARGGSAGLGISLIVDPSSGNVVVASVTKGSPAKKGGVVPGDVIVEVDGMDTKAATAELVAAKCRGEPGSFVNVAVRHEGKNKLMPLSLTRAKIKMNPVETSTVTVDNKKVGLLKVAAFSQETVSQIVDALRDVKSASAIVIDLRGNVGGYMPAGVDVAKLSPKTRIISEVDKTTIELLLWEFKTCKASKMEVVLLSPKPSTSHCPAEISMVLALRQTESPKHGCGADDSAATCLTGIV